MTYTDDLEVTLTVENCTVEDAGEYTLQIVNEAGQTECTITVVIDFTAPTFTLPLKDVPTLLSEDVTFTAQVAGSPAPSTKWLISGLGIESTDKYQIAPQKEETMTTTLTVTAVTLDDAEMEYTCKAASAAGSATSSARIILQGVFITLS